MDRDYLDKGYVYGWFEFADTDLALAEHSLSMKPQPLWAICYHCQQSAEKYLKGYLLYNGVESPPKIHDLVNLNKKCSEFDSEFNNILDECEALTQFGVQPRYPDEIYIDETLMNLALEYAKRVKEFIPLQNVREELKQVSKKEESR
jgi:HEPN domain-containing protein